MQPSDLLFCEFREPFGRCIHCGNADPGIEGASVLCLKPRISFRVHHASTSGGPGTELSKLLKRFRIEPTPTCQCRAKAAQMDAWGPDECEKPERIEEVLAVMREEAKARGLPFIDLAGRLLIRRAIRNARKAAAQA